MIQTFPEAELVAWVAIDDLKIWRWQIELEGITFYDGRWWGPVVKAGAGQLPPELAGRMQVELDSLFFELLQRDPEVSPFVVARVELSRCRVPNAAQEASRIAMTVLHLGGLRAGQLGGVAFEGGVVFQGQEIVGGNSFSLDTDFAEVRKERHDDHALGDALVHLEPALLRAARAGDEDFVNAMASVDWLKQTKALTPSQQVALGIRAVEQVFAASDDQHWSTAVLQRLSHPWAITEIGNRVHTAVSEAITSLGGSFERAPSDEERRDFLEVQRYVIEGDRFFLRRAVERIEWLRDRITQPRLDRELRMLQTHLGSGPATADWLRDLEAEFARNLNRVHRLRNAILHGYPIEQNVVDASRSFARSIAIHAVHASVDAMATDVPLRAYLTARQADSATLRQRLENGMPAADALGWTAGT